MKNRISHWRERRGLSMQALADKANTTASTISKLEKGGMRLTTQWMEKIAAALKVDPADLLTSNPRGELVDDVIAFTPREDDPLASLGKLPNHKIYVVETDVLQDLGIKIGDRLIIDTSREAIETIAPLASVILNYFQFGEQQKNEKPKVLLRQFLPPDKFVANSPEMLQPAINRSAESIEIIGVVVLHPRDFRPQKMPPNSRRRNGTT